MTRPVSELKGDHLGECCHIVGMGMSLKYLSKAHFTNGPIIAMNESVCRVSALGLDNPLYSMQKDGGNLKACPKRTDRSAECPTMCGNMVRPAGREILLIHEYESKLCFDDYEQRYLFDNVEDFGYLWNMPSFCVAVSMAELFGCTSLQIISCDRLSIGKKGRAAAGQFVEDPTVDYLPGCWQRSLQRSPIKRVRHVTPDRGE